MIRKTINLNLSPKHAKIDALMGDLHLQCQLQLSTIEASVANISSRMGIEARSHPNSPRGQFSWCFDEMASAAANFGDPSRPTANADFAPPILGAVPLAKPNALESSTSIQPDDAAIFAAPMSLPNPRRRSIRGWPPPALAAATFAILAGTFFLPGSSRKSAHSLATLESTASASPTAQSAPNSSPSTPTISASIQVESLRPDAHEVTLSPIRPSSGGGAVSHASITATGTSWVAACSDGMKIFQKMFVSGDTQEVEFSQVALVRLGNGPAVDIEVDGKSIEPVGLSGVSQAIELTPGGARFLLWNSPNRTRACGKTLDTVSPKPATVASR
jgi:hypothetical protein